MVTVKINGKEVTVADNSLILDAAREAGYEIPTFCYQADLMGVGSCRMCLVEIEGQKKLQPACVTPVLHGMSISTETPTVMSSRSAMLEFLLANHAMDCPVCDKGGECELQDMVYKYGPHKGRHAEPKFKFQEKDYTLSPVIIKNSNRCVQCMKCVRVCREVVGANVLGSLGRGDHQEETSFFRHFLDCDQDGNCIEVCPVGCFMRLPYRYKARPWDLKGADSICPHCAVGCRLIIEERDGVVLRARAQLGVGLNSETLCARGRFGTDFMSSGERIKSPLIRRGGSFEPVSWQEALEYVRENLGAFEGARIGGIASPRLANEELYIFQKLFREVLGSGNVDSSVRWSPEAVESFIAATSMDKGGVSVFDCMESDAVIIIGSHLSDENPVTDYIVRRISAGRRMHVVIASPRAMKLDSSATQTLRHAPGAEWAVLEALILALNAPKVEGSAPVKAIKDERLEVLLKAAGITAAEVEALAAKIRGAESVAIMAGTEFLRFPEGSAPLSLFKDLVKSLGKKVSVMPSLDRCNQRGAWEMGVHPYLGPGLKRLEARGLSSDAMLEAALRGDFDALYVAGNDLLGMYKDEEFARKALSSLKFLVVQDIFLSETAKLAHVILPGAAFGEKEGVFTNQEGRAQIIRKLLPPPGKAKRDFDIIRAIGERFEPSFGPKNPVLALDEIRERIGMYGEVSLLFNNKRNTENKLDNKGSLVKSSELSGARVTRFEPRDAGADSRHPFVLVTGNHLFHSGRLTRKSQSLITLLNSAVVEISEEDACRLGVKSGEKVKVKNSRHEAVMMVKTFRRGSRSGIAFLAENFDEVRHNSFARRGEDVTRVSIEKA